MRTISWMERDDIRNEIGKIIKIVLKKAGKGDKNEMWKRNNVRIL